MFLSRKLISCVGKFDVVAAIPRGGVVVGFEISRKLHIPIVPLVVKKIPSSGEPELAVGAIDPGGFSLGTKNKEIENIVAERIKTYGHETDFSGKNIILTDDGIATGATMETAVYYLKKMNARKIIVAVPVVGRSEYEKFSKIVDRVIALTIPENFRAIGEFYQNFDQVEESDVIQLLER